VFSGALELGDSRDVAEGGLTGGKLGFGLLRGGEGVRMWGWMAWLELDAAERLRQPSPAEPAGSDTSAWVFPHVELGAELLRRSFLFGWVEVGPTLGRYVAGDSTLWFPGLAVGGGLQWFPLRVGVRYYAQSRRAKIETAGVGGADEVRIEPMLFLTLGLELSLPLIP